MRLKHEAEQEKPDTNLQLGRKGALRISSRFLMTLFGLISTIVIKRNMGYETIGMLAFAVAYVEMFNILGDLGVSTAHNKRVNEHELDEGKCNGTYITIRLILNIFMIGTILSSILVYKHVLGYNYESELMEWVLYLTIFRFFIEHNIETFKIINAAKLEIAKNLVPRIIGRFLQMLMKCGIAIIGFSATYLVGAEIVACTLILLMLFLLFRGAPLKRFNRSYFKIYATFALPVIFIGLVGSLSHRLDKVMIQVFVDSEEVGIYSIPLSISLIFLMIAMQITKLLFPTFSRLHSRKKFEQINLLSNRAVKYISMSMIAPLVFFLVFAEPVMVLLFGSDAAVSAPILQVLLLGTYVTAIVTPYAIQVVSTGHLKIALGLSSLTLILVVVLNAIFIPDDLFGYQLFGLGGLGAAITTSLSLFIRGIFAKYFAKKLTGTRGYTRIWTHLLAGGLSAVVGYLIWTALPTDWYFLPLYGFAILVTSFIILFITKEFTRKEFDFFWNAINPRKMKRYIVTEIRGQ